MRSRRRSARFPWAALSASVALAGLAFASFTPGAAAQEPTVVYVVRHAEKAPGTGDVPLSSLGRARASLLANMLSGTQVASIHSTDFIRTRDTVTPLARRFGLDVQIYDPAAPEKLVGHLAGSGGIHVVVGHSDTVPELVRLMGAEPGPPIEEGEYDRLYLVAMPRGGGDPVATIVRFGAPFGR